MYYTITLKFSLTHSSIFRLTATLTLTLPPSQSLLHPHTHSSTFTLTPPPSHSLLHPHTHSSTPTLTPQLSHSLLHPLTHSTPTPTIPLPHSLLHLHTPHSPDQLQSAGREVFLKLVLVQLLHTRPQHASRAAMYDLQWTDTPF